MPVAESDFKAEELDSIINVIGLKPSDPLDGFGGKKINLSMSVSLSLVTVS